MTVLDRLSEAESRARHTGSDATPWDARILLAHAVGHGKPLLLDPGDELPAEAASRFRALWERRLSGVPVQHLVGEWDFFGRPFSVDGRGLIPRPETEVLVLQAIGAAPGTRRILDLGTGSGIIAVTLLQELPEARAIAIDASVDALALARKNAIRHGVLPRLGLVASDWLAALEGPPFDLVVSNPPYLARSEAGRLSRTVADHDPALALYGGDDGLECIRGLLDAVPAVLPPGAPFLFEIGFGQARDVEREARSRPEWRFEGISVDLSGIPRVTRLRRA